MEAQPNRLGVCTLIDALIDWKADSRAQKQELGRHAFESAMPASVSRVLQQDGWSNDVHHVIPRLSHLMRQKHIQSGYVCSAQATLVHRLAREGNDFCGYRNLQMLCLALGLAGFHDHLRDRCSILDLQAMIEDAWKAGHNAHGLTETGGIRGTRKHIGTQEVEALLQHLKIPYDARRFVGKDAARKLLDFVSTYFSAAANSRASMSGMTETDLMPLFLQRPHHSVTIVGIATLPNNKRTLLVFDPALPRSFGIRTTLKSRLLVRLINKVELLSHCRSESYLERHSAFEILAAGTIATGLAPS